MTNLYFFELLRSKTNDQHMIDLLNDYHNYICIVVSEEEIIEANNKLQDLLLANKKIHANKLVYLWKLNPLCVRSKKHCHLCSLSSKKCENILLAIYIFCLVSKVTITLEEFLVVKDSSNTKKPTTFLGGW